jgi:hypothetical protein
MVQPPVLLSFKATSCSNGHVTLNIWQGSYTCSPGAGVQQYTWTNVGLLASSTATPACVLADGASTNAAVQILSATCDSSSDPPAPAKAIELYASANCGGAPMVYPVSTTKNACLSVNGQLSIQTTACSATAASVVVNAFSSNCMNAVLQIPTTVSASAVCSPILPVDQTNPVYPNGLSAKMQGACSTTVPAASGATPASAGLNSLLLATAVMVLAAAPALFAL